MDASQGFTLLRELGRAGHGGYLNFDALVAIHMTHRLFAVLALGALVWGAWRLWRQPGLALRRYGVWLAAALLWQAGSGLSNVVLGWPIAAALAHSAGAAVLVALLTSLWARLQAGGRVAAVSLAAPVAAATTVPHPRAAGGPRPA